MVDDVLELVEQREALSCRAVTFDLRGDVFRIERIPVDTGFVYIVRRESLSDFDDSRVLPVRGELAVKPL